MATPKLGLNGQRVKLPVNPQSVTPLSVVVEWGSLIAGLSLLLATEAFQPWMHLSLGLLLVSTVARGWRLQAFSAPTPLDLPLVLFLTSAVVAWWASPDRAAATGRLYLILGAISSFYALVNSDSRTLRRVSAGLIVSLASIGVLAASQHDWANAPARFSPIRRAGMLLNSLVPRISASEPPWNAVRNLMASSLSLAVPLAMTLAWQESRRWINRRRPRLKLLTAVTLGGMVLLFGLALTESRTPWLGALPVLVLAGWWWITRELQSRTGWSQAAIFWAGLVVPAVVLGVSTQSLGDPGKLLGLIPGPDSATGRQEIYTQSWLLAKDVPFTGGGLAAYPALYSTYIQVSPFNVFLNEDTGNNAYLNLLVEQGWLGLGSYLLVLVVGLGAAIRRLPFAHQRYTGFLVAGILGLVYILLQNLAHATLVSTRAIPMVFVPAGFALAGRNRDRQEKLQVVWRSNAMIAGVFLGGLACLVILGFTSPGIRAAWLANLGAVDMGKVQLAGWPMNRFDDGRSTPAMGEAVQTLEQSLANGSINRTAHHRLGVYYLLAGQYEIAVEHLEFAHQAEPGHRGLRKNLGYAYTWLGESAAALPLLRDLPEASREMLEYAGWWEQLGSPDLAERSAEMAASLASSH